MKNNQTTKQFIERRYEELADVRLEKHRIHQQIERKLQLRTAELQQAKKSRLLKLMQPKYVKQLIRHTGAYILGRRNRKNLYSKTYKEKDAQNQLKGYITALYDKGFTEKAIIDLEQKFKKTINQYERRAIAWELGLWFANKETTSGAIQAIPYLSIAKKGYTSLEMQRRISILMAECYLFLKQTEKAKCILTNQIKQDTHPDLMVAMANTETEIAAKLTWINQVYQRYQLEPIHFCPVDDTVGYDDLEVKSSPNQVNGPKVSVILPAFNSEDGIRIAIESILQQSWVNLELIIVDDKSTDSTLAVAKEYAQLDERVLVLQNKENSGPYIARNLGLQHATGEFVTVNDADDWSHTKKLEIQANHLIKHPNIIANTSQLIRLTETLQFYRRGTPGKYIFSNMSSLLFRRKEVMEKLGYWDSVRFAADGEFKRRLILTFGKQAITDLETGPLSLPRQTASSLTGVSAFGYNGFFMGARKEYVESFTHYHQTADTLYYPNNQSDRLFPIPEPMRPQRNLTKRYFDITMVADFTAIDNKAMASLEQEINKNKQLGLTTALVQMYRYRPEKVTTYHKGVRKLVDGSNVQIVVYGEEIDTNVLIIRSPAVLMEKQLYIPKIHPKVCLNIIDEMPIIQYNNKKVTNYNFRQSLYSLMSYFDKRGRWYPLNKETRKLLEEKHRRELATITLATEDWQNEHELDDEKYAIRLKDWLL